MRTSGPIVWLDARLMMIVPLRRGLVKFQAAAEAYWPFIPQKYVRWKVSITSQVNDSDLAQYLT